MMYRNMAALYHFCVMQVSSSSGKRVLSSAVLRNPLNKNINQIGVSNSTRPISEAQTLVRQKAFPQNITQNIYKAEYKPNGKCRII